MRSRYRIRRRTVRRAAPAVRRATPAMAMRTGAPPAEHGVLVGGARDPAENRADRLAARVLGGGPAPGASVASAAGPPGAVRRACTACGAGSGADEARPVRRMCADCAAEQEGMATDGTRARRSAAAPVLAPGAAPARAGPAASRAVARLGQGRALDASARAFFEPRFGRDLSAVRIHDGPAAERAARALDARAFAIGSDVALGRGAGRATLAHELAHVVTEPGGTLHRDLCREPPGRTAEPDPLDEAEQADAAAFNTARYNATSTEIILDMMGAPGRTAFTPEMSSEIQDWQADFRLEPDGKVGLRTLETLGEAMIACGERIRVMRLIVDGHNFSLANVGTFAFDRTVTDNAETDGAPGARQRVRVGPPGFRQGYRGLVHTIRHELDHVAVRFADDRTRSDDEFDAFSEFRGEAIEIESRGMLQESFAGLMTDAERGIDNWENMRAADQTAEADLFRRARDRLIERWNAASAAQRTAARQAIIDRWNAVTP